MCHFVPLIGPLISPWVPLIGPFVHLIGPLISPWVPLIGPFVPPIGPLSVAIYVLLEDDDDLKNKK